MVWFFERGDESLKWEVRRRSDAYEIATERSDATPEVRAFETPAELLAEIEAIPQALIRDGWRAINQDLVMLAAPLAQHS
jgi:hypothetical protein